MPQRVDKGVLSHGEIRSVGRFDRPRSEHEQVAHVEPSAGRGRRLKRSPYAAANRAVVDIQLLDVVLVAIGRQHVIHDRVFHGDPRSRGAGAPAAQPKRDLRVEHGNAIERRFDVFLQVERRHVADEPVAESRRRDVANREGGAAKGAAGLGIDGVLARQRRPPRIRFPRRGSGASQMRRLSSTTSRQPGAARPGSIWTPSPEKV